MQKKISILGATGSVGRQALEVAEHLGMPISLLCARQNVTLAEQLCRRYLPHTFVMTEERAARDLRTRLADLPVCVLGGDAALDDAIRGADSSVVVNAIGGADGLLPSLAVLDSGARLALANKETLVIAGDLVMQRQRDGGSRILPVDSEHCAIHQCITDPDAVSRILLTASGGPYFGKTREQLRFVSARDTLRHPTWSMGARISVDSATLMNKGFEIIEAAYLFGVPVDRIEVLVHRESIIHSAVEYIDNVVLAQMSVADMRACVQYAVEYPTRTRGLCAPLDLFAVGSLTFARPDPDTFPLLSLAREAMRVGGGMGAVLNAADEVAVAAHLSGRLSFLGISEVVLATFEALRDRADADTLEMRLAADRDARRVAEELVVKFGV